jgi:hypothetical protein
VDVFYQLDHPLKRRLQNLRELNMGETITRDELPALFSAILYMNAYENTFWGSSLYVLGGVFPRTGDGEIQAYTIRFAIHLTEEGGFSLPTFYCGSSRQSSLFGHLFCG